MKSSLKKPISSLTGLFAVGMIVGASTPAQALTWNGGPGIWNNTNPNWSGTSTWSPGGLAQFPNSGAAIVTIGDNLNVGALQFNTVNSGPYTFSNSGGYTVDFTTAGISSSTANVQVFNSNGIINFNNGSSSGDSSISISSNGTVNFNNTSNAGTSLLTNSGSLNFTGTSTASNSQIDNLGTLVFANTASGGTTSISNGSILDISGNTSGSVAIGSLNNSSSGNVGGVFLGQNNLQLSGGLTLANISGQQNTLDFTLATPGTSGTITIASGQSITSLGTGLVDILLETNSTVAPGTYTLIDWTGSTNNGVNLADFNLVGPLPNGVAAEHLQIVGSQLQLVAVPEPSSLVMPFAGVLGMVWLRRRASRAAAV